MALGVTCLLVGSSIAFVGSEIQPSNIVPWKAPDFTNNSVIVLGISDISGVAKDALRQTTDRVMFIEDIGSLSVTPEKDILIIDGHWLNNESSIGVLEVIIPLAENGTPVALIDGNASFMNELFVQLGSRVQGSYQDGADVYGYKASPTCQGWGCIWTGFNGDDGYYATMATFIEAYEWGGEFLSNTPP